MAKLYTHEEVYQMFRKMVSQSTQKAVAAQLGISISFVNDVLQGKKALSERVARQMGFEPVYRKVT